MSVALFNIVIVILHKYISLFLLLLNTHLLLLLLPILIDLFLPLPEPLLHLLHILLGMHDIGHDLRVDLAHIMFELALDVRLVQVVLHQLADDAHAGGSVVGQVEGNREDTVEESVPRHYYIGSGAFAVQRFQRVSFLLLYIFTF